jgi:hypothetical protein
MTNRPSTTPHTLNMPGSATAMLMPWHAPSPQPAEADRTVTRRRPGIGLRRAAPPTHTTKEVSA